MTTPIIDLPESTTRSSLHLSPISSPHIKPSKPTTNRISFKITKRHAHSKTSLQSDYSQYLSTKHSNFPPSASNSPQREPFDTQSSPIIKPKALSNVFTFSGKSPPKTSKPLNFLLDTSFSPASPGPQTQKHPNNNPTIYTSLSGKAKDSKKRKKTSLIESFVRENSRSQKDLKINNDAMEKINSILLRCKKLNKEVQDVERRVESSQDKYEKSVEKLQKTADIPKKFDFWRTDKNFLIQRKQVKENLKKFWDESKERSKSPKDGPKSPPKTWLSSLQALDNENNRFQGGTLPTEIDEERGMKIGSITVNEPKPQSKMRRIGSSILQERFEKYAEFTRKGSITNLNDTNVAVENKSSQKMLSLVESTHIGNMNTSSFSMTKQEIKQPGQPEKKKKIVMKILNKYLQTPQIKGTTGLVNNYSVTGRSSFFGDMSDYGEERGNSLQRANRRIERKQTRLLQLMTGESSLEELEQDYSMFKKSKTKKKRSALILAPSIFISNASIGNL